MDALKELKIHFDEISTLLDKETPNEVEKIMNTKKS